MIALTVPSIQDQNGTHRVGPVALRMSEDLDGVTEFDYDNSLPDFQEYCRRRGVPCYVEAGEDHATCLVLYYYKAKQQDAWELFIGYSPESENPPIENDRKLELLRII